MYQSNGLAEIVRNPSQITKKYLDIWFTGNGSFGTGLKILGWPITKNNSPILVLSKDGVLQTDLKVEEAIMYSKTIFSYVKKNGDYLLQINLKKIFSPVCLWGTILCIWSQSKLLINFQNTYNFAKKLVENIPLEIPENKDDLENTIKNEVFPYLIAVDYIGEFVHSALVNNLSTETKAELVANLHKRISPKDWYTKAILVWSKLQDKEITEKEFLPIYGFAAGNDYELASPRFYELLNISKPQIKNLEIENMDVKSLEDLYVGTQYLRSIAKLKSLIWISALRDSIFKKS